MDENALTRFRCRACATFLKTTLPNATTSFWLGNLTVLKHSAKNDCTEHALDILTAGSDNNVNDTNPRHTSSFARIEEILYSNVVLAICFIGLAGNMLNLFVLVPRGLKRASGRMEKFAYSGLIALALSNMLFCLTTIPYGFLSKKKIYFDTTFALIFHAYNNAIINTFILASTWLTVTLAVGRYYAVCYPLRAREMLGMTCAKRTIASVILVCILFNIPRFFTYSIAEAKCGDGTSLYFQFYGYMKLNTTFDTTFNWTYFVVGIVIPLFLLIFCNAYLIYALRMYRVTSDRIRANRNQKETSNHMTLTLVIIIVMYIVLVSPAEMINFLKEQFRSSESVAMSDAYNFAVAIVNTLQAFNFAFTFLPYCAINTHFRSTISSFLSRKLGRKSYRNSTERSYSSCRHNMSDPTTTELCSV